MAAALGKRPARNPRRKDVIAPRQVSWLAGRHVGLAFPAGKPASDTYRPPLTAYSCGGSAGLGLKGRTGFPS